MKEAITIMFATCGILVGAFGITFGLITWQNNYTCHRYGRLTNHEVRAAAPAACYVKTDKGWFTYEQIRSFQ